MANTQHLKQSSKFKLPKNKEEIGFPFEELRKNDYPVLSKALVKKGSLKLLSGDNSGLEFFDMALKIDSSNPRTYIDQSLSLFDYGSIEGNEQALTLGSKRLKIATTLDPQSFEAWNLWGNTLYLLGLRKNEPSYFANACKKYKQAITLIETQSPNLLAELYWDYGNVWTQLAEISGEAMDFHAAIQAYEKALTFETKLPAEFWMNSAQVYFKLGNKTNDTRLFIQSINSYKNAIALHLSFQEGWASLAATLHKLYTYTHDEDHFSQANECYSTAIQLSDSKPQEVYFKWGLLLLESGTVFQDVSKLRSCIKKCHQAQNCGPDNPYVIGMWAEALALVGVLTDKLDLLNEAQNKINSLVDQAEDPETLYSQGRVLTALGTYYKDSDYYYQATERFQEGLSLDRTHHKLWNAIGNSTLSAALIDQDEQSYERACHFFERALRLNINSTYHCHYAICLSKYGDFLQDQKMLETSIHHFEQALGMQQNAVYLHAHWVFHYACTLALLGGFIESDSHYIKALDLLNHLLMVNPEFPGIQHNLAIVYSHYAELISEPDLYYKAIHHYRIAYQKEKENDQTLLDWALTLLNLGDLLENDTESDQLFREAEYKMIQAAKLGNIHAYYSLACLYSFLGDLQNSLRFLEKSKVYESLPPIDELLEDDWLENVRETEGFHVLLAELESHAKDQGD